MRKFYLMAIVAFALANNATAQIQDGANGQSILDIKEDTTLVTSLDDILQMQEEIHSLSSGETRVRNVWKRNKYRNFGYNTAKMESDGKVPLGQKENGDEYSRILSFESDWGASITLGTNYRLHKPIANIVSIGLDYTWFDLNVHHFKVDCDEAGAERMYNSSDQNEDLFHYMPWEQEKYEGEFGMMLGPSLTIAPFIMSRSNALAHLRFQVYYHIGYRLSVALIRDKDNGHDENPDHYFSVFMCEWGHGVYSAFGINLSWKSIGFGYETNSGDIEYKSLSSSDFGDGKTKFKQTSNRVYLQIRF